MRGVRGWILAAASCAVVFGVAGLPVRAFGGEASPDATSFEGEKRLPARTGLKLPSPADLGLTARESKDTQGRKVLEFVDTATGNRLRTVYSHTGEIESMEQYSPAGALLNRREMHSGKMVQNTYIPERSTRVLRNAGAGHVSVEYRSWKQGRLSSSYDLVLPTDEINRCNPPTPPANYSDLLANLDWINLRAGTASGDTVQLGNNVQAEGCGSYPGGADGLARELTTGLREGLACMSRMGGARRMDAASMLAFLQPGYARHARIRCGTTGAVLPPATSALSASANAQAHTCTTPALFPAMDLNLSNLASSSSTPRDRRSTMVHEMLHWLGYSHYEGFDLTYLVQNCCVPEGDPASAYTQDQMEQACSLLQDSPEWRSRDYQVRYSRLMGIGRPNVAARTAWYAMQASNHLPPPDQLRRDGAPAFLAAIEIGKGNDAVWTPAQWRQDGSPFLGSILGMAAAHNTSSAHISTTVAHLNTHVRDKYYPSTDPALAGKRQLANWVGQILGDVTSGSWQHIRTIWPQVTAARDQTCASLSANERSQLNTATGMGALQVLRAGNDASGQANLPTDITLNFNPLCR